MSLPVTSAAPTSTASRSSRPSFIPSRVWLILYFVLLLLPIYWMVNMSLRTNEDILGVFSLVPRNPTLANYKVIFTDSSWYNGYINSIIYVVMNTVLSVLVALPAAYAFSRYTFLGDKHLFFWLLTNRMAPPAVFLLPFFQLYSSLNLIDTHIAVALAHMLFNVPLSVWILEGFMSGVPKEIDETAYIDGYSFSRFLGLPPFDGRTVKPRESRSRQPWQTKEKLSPQNSNSKPSNLPEPTATSNKPLGISALPQVLCTVGFESKNNRKSRVVQPSQDKANPLLQNTRLGFNNLSVISRLPVKSVTS